MDRHVMTRPARKRTILKRRIPKRLAPKRPTSKRSTSKRPAIEHDIGTAARRLLVLCRKCRLLVATAESCTGGLVVAALTEIPGSSAVVDRSFVTYSNAAKQRMLGVTVATLDTHGAVSQETAEAMAQGALANSEADLTVAITGIAGPGGATPGKPVGLVHFAAAARDGRLIHRARTFGEIGRRRVRLKSVVEALAMLELLARDFKLDA
jgi:nicotinamide-nucleotide amidase